MAMENFETEFSKGIRDTLAEYMSSMDAMLDRHFNMSMADKELSLFMLSHRAMQQIVDQDTSAPKNTDEAAAYQESSLWMSEKFGTPTKRALLTSIAFGTVVAGWVESRLIQQEWTSAAALLSSVANIHGMAMATAMEIERKSSNGKKGAAGRRETIDEMIAKSMAIIRSLGVEKLPASHAAEKARINGAPLSYEKLVRLIRSERKGDLDSKTRSEDS
ncbi:hypothetical protein [Burkholderia sp. Bp8991]|uniref:hypothetical protein n=1 Tax=Burkholderia sp. Bp8991 TaxID=2184553 RepID=UPI000F5952CE|nr:hypothetical protein [Burkholderia sp. Bp8991]RQS00234.1 hypothetical protein DIE02_27765 [Burkholderia sp. Bp8991]